MARMVRAALSGDWNGAREINRKYFRLMQANFWETSPGPVKAVMAMMGKLAEEYRLPMMPVAKATREKLSKLALELGLSSGDAQEKGHLRTD
jgi:4-hydroxy-tetrahydrodipicolinate synthase